MSKLLGILLLSVSIGAQAHDGFRGNYGGGYHEYHHGGGNNWIAPAIIGGIVGYELNRSYGYNQGYQGFNNNPYVGQYYQGCRPIYQTLWAPNGSGRVVPIQQYMGCN